MIKSQSHTYKVAVLSALLLAVAACGAKPRHQSLRSDPASSVQFLDLPAGAIVYVDGIEITTAPGPKGVANVSVLDGMREITVKYNGSEIYKRNMFIQDGTTKRVRINK